MEIIEELQTMQDYLEITPSDNPEELIERLTTINTYMARSSFLIAELKYLKDHAVAQAFFTHKEKISEMPASLANKFIDSICYEANKLYTWIDRINRTCVHQGENLRTQISFIKEQLKLTRTGY